MSEGVIARNTGRVWRTLRVSETDRGFLLMGARICFFRMAHKDFDSDLVLILFGP